VNFATHEVVQDLGSGQPQGKAVLSVDGKQLFVPQGTDRIVAAYDVGDDGLLAQGSSVEVGDRVVALHAAADGKTLWAARFTERELVSIDLPSLQVRKRIPLAQGAWDILELASRSELYISDLAGSKVAVVDTTTETVVASINLPSSPAGMTQKPDDSVVWVAVSGSDYVVAIDTATRTVTNHGLVAEMDLVDPSGMPLPNSNPNAVAYEPTMNRLYVSRGTDNAVTVFDADTLAYLGSFPTSWWPTDLDLPNTAPGTLLVTEGQGGGMDAQPNANGERSNINNGTLTAVDLSTLDLAATTQLVKANELRSIDRYRFDCASGKFPIPTREGQTSPIEHVVLVVKENKKFDTVFGDVNLPGVDADPGLVSFTADIVPNQRKLARDFNVSDRFFLESQESNGGHLFLTAAHWTEFTQRFWAEPPDSLGISWPLRDAAVPDSGNVFTYMLDHGKTIRIYGEIVGTNLPAANGVKPIVFSDVSYPGGPIFNLGARDRDRANYLVAKANNSGLPDFTFISLPDDHTEGSTPGRPTPESHVADNDEGVGILVDGLSHNEELWKTTVIFILEDDPQSSGDHVSAARSFLTVVSPWARRAYVSHHQTSYLSVYATIFRILGLPPLGREAATAAPLWDLFTEEPDFTPWSRLPRTYPEEINPPAAFGAAVSARMDFRSPDRNPGLGRLLDLYRSWKLGRLTRRQAEQKLLEPADPEEYQELLTEAVEEQTAWDSAFKEYNAWLATQGKKCLPDGRVVSIRDEASESR
jgi:YVTN family beta-propeller protein